MAVVVRPPFVLPDEPVDQYTIEYFVVDYGLSNLVVRHMRAVYHANTKWLRLYKSNGGADFVDEWQMFMNDNFVGRNEGWKGWVFGKNWNGVYATAMEAEREVVDFLRKEIARFEAKVASLKEEISLRLQRLEKASKQEAAAK